MSCYPALVIMPFKTKRAKWSRNSEVVNIFTMFSLGIDLIIVRG